MDEMFIVYTAVIVYKMVELQKYFDKLPHILNTGSIYTGFIK